MITDDQKSKINEIMSITESFVGRIEKGVVKGEESGSFFSEQIRAIKGLFNNSSDEWRIIDRWEYENNFKWRPAYRSESYAGEKEKEKFSKLLDLLYKLLPSEKTSIAAEFHFSVEQTYEAKRFIGSLFRRAGKKIVIVDEYLDDQFFNYLDIVSENVEIQIITGESKKIFWDIFSELIKKRKNIEARVNKTSHCRYIVIDESIIYSTDASFNTIGKKDFMIHKVEDENEFHKVKKQIENYWKNGKIKY